MVFRERFDASLLSAAVLARLLQLRGLGQTAVGHPFGQPPQWFRMLRANRLGEPRIPGRGAQAGELLRAFGDRCASAEPERERVEMHPPLAGRNMDGEIEQHGVQRLLPHAQPRADDARLRQGRVARRAVWLVIDRALLEQRDGAAATPAKVMQATTMLGTNHGERESPGPAEVRPGIRLQAARAILQHRQVPAQPVANLSPEQKAAVLQQDVFGKTRHRVLGRTLCNGQRSASQVLQGLTGDLREPPQRCRRHILIDVVAEPTERVVRELARLRAGGDGGAPEPTA